MPNRNFPIGLCCSAITIYTVILASHLNALDPYLLINFVAKNSISKHTLIDANCGNKIYINYVNLSEKPVFNNEHLHSKEQL